MTAPEGFEGELRMITFVRGVIRVGHHLRRDAKSLRLIRFEQHALPARVAHNVFERNPVGNGKNHFIAVIHQHLDRIEQSMFSASGSDDFFAPVI